MRTTEKNSPEADQFAKPATPPGMSPAIVAELQQAFEQARRYASIQIDLARLRLTQSLRQLLLMATAGFVGLVVLAMSAIYVLRGLAGALSELTGGRTWAGFMLCGFSGFVMVAIAVWWSQRRFAQAALERSMRKYGHTTQPGNAADDSPHLSANIPPAGGGHGPLPIDGNDPSGSQAQPASA